MISRIRIKSFFVSLALAFAGLFAPAQAALAVNAYIVNDTGTGTDCGSLVATHSTIASAVSDAIDNNVKTIRVCPGEYGNFMVDLANKLTIKAAIPDSFPTVKAPAASGGIIVNVQNSSGVVLDGLLFNGANFTDALTANAFGVYYHNASGTVQNSTVYRVRTQPTPADYGYGIRVEHDNGDGKQYTVTVKNVDITDVDEAGIYAKGPTTKVSISDTNIAGTLTATGTGAAQWGVLFTGGATGSVTDSTIAGSSSGVWLLGTDQATISDNVISGASLGVSLQVECANGNETAISNKISGNTVVDTLGGVALYASTPDCTSINKTTISGNRLTGRYQAGAGVAFYMAGNSIVNATKITGNTMFGFFVDVYDGATSTNTQISGNTWIR